MILPPIARLRVELPSPGVSAPKARAVAKAVCVQAFGAGARVIKSDDRTSVLAGEAAGYEVVVKALALDRLKDRIRAATRLSRHWRQARGAHAADGAGIAVASVLAIVRGADSQGHSVEALIMERVEGTTLLRVAAERKLPAECTRSLLDRVGRDVGRLARSGLVNRDHKPSNLIVDIDAEGELCPVLIDTADIRRSGPKPAIVTMLSKLLIEANGTDVPVARLQQARVARAALRESELDMRLGEVLDAVRSVIDAHGDPRPKHDPLSFDE